MYLHLKRYLLLQTCHILNLVLIRKIYSVDKYITMLRTIRRRNPKPLVTFFKAILQHFTITNMASVGFGAVIIINMSNFITQSP